MMLVQRIETDYHIAKGAFHRSYDYKANLKERTT